MQEVRLSLERDLATDSAFHSLGEVRFFFVYYSSCFLLQIYLLLEKNVNLKELFMVQDSS